MQGYFILNSLLMCSKPNTLSQPEPYSQTHQHDTDSAQSYEVNANLNGGVLIRD